ncbi:AMP-binding protein [Pseudomonadota bacterium]
MISVLGPIDEWTEKCPDKLLFSFLDIQGRTKQSYTYVQFMQRAKDIASYLYYSHAIPKHSRVLLAFPPGLELICAFFACIRLGLIPVPVSPPSSRGFLATIYKLQFIANDCGAHAVLTDKEHLWSIKLRMTREEDGENSLLRADLSKLHWISCSDAPTGVDHDYPEAHSEILFLQYTSGSTRRPRGVMVTHKNILENCDAVVDHLPVGVSWLPQYHDMGLIGYYLFFVLKGGTTYGFSPLDFIRKPALWLDTISRYRATASSAPNFAFEYCLRPGSIPQESMETLDLSSLQFLMTAAEPVSGDIFRRFIRKFSPCGLDPKYFFSAYGLAEFTLAVSNYGRKVLKFDRDSLSRNIARPVTGYPTPVDTKTLVSCGRPLQGVEIRIVDDEGSSKELHDGQVGEIWVRGPSKCLGYWNKPELTSKLFRARLPNDHNHFWLRTGDLGFIHEKELYVCGRKKDLIIIRGLNYYPQDIEFILEKNPSVKNGCVAAFAVENDSSEQLVVVAGVHASARLPDTRILQRSVAQKLGVAVNTFIFVRSHSIAKTSSGKIARHQVHRDYLAGTLDILYQESFGDELAPDLDQPELCDGEMGAQCSGFETVLKKYGLSGAETWTLLDAGLDSIRLVELSTDLKNYLLSHGYGYLSNAVDLRVLQEIAICELNGLLTQLVTSAPFAKSCFLKSLSDLKRQHRKSEKDMMVRDTKLRFDPTQLTSIRTSSTKAEDGVFLTGGTGFFGPFLLASLIKMTTGPIHVLVRADNVDEAEERLLTSLSLFWPIASALSLLNERVRPICGDLGKVNLGLTTALWNDLAESVHSVYHNGALVNYLLDYANMRDANVGGTNEAIRLAMSHRSKMFNYISTTFVFGWSKKNILYESDNNMDMDLLDFGYSQSKWVSEQVVFDAMDHGLNARIFRPALITPPLDGNGSNLDISIRLLAFMMKHRIGTSAANQVSFSPADIAADNIVAISQLPDSINSTFHVTRDTYANMLEITDILGDLTNNEFKIFKLKDFVPEVIERCQPSDILFPLLEFLVRSVDNISEMEFKRYDNRNFEKARAASDQGRADPPLRNVVLGILRFMRRQGVLYD